MKIFLSAVSAQFKACRDTLASDLRAIGCEVQVQEDFRQGPHTLIERLEEYVAQCDRVIALVGDAYGFEASGVRVPLVDPPRSLTQWEYFFALGERLDGSRASRKELYLYFASDQFLERCPVEQSLEHAERQRRFRKRIEDDGQHWRAFDSVDQLCRLVLRDGWQMQERPAAAPRLSDRQAEQRHRERIIEEYATVDIQGRTTSLDLEQIYIALRVGGHVAPAERPDEASRRTGQAESPARAEVIDAVEALRRKPNRLVVLGEPGSGKTTLLKYLALKIAGLDRVFGDWAREIVASRPAAVADRIQRRLVALGEQTTLSGLVAGVLALLVWAVGVYHRSSSRPLAAAAGVGLGVALLLIYARFSRRTVGIGAAVGVLVLAASAHLALVPPYAVWTMGVAVLVILSPYLIAGPVTWLTWLRHRLTRYPLPLYLTLNDVGRRGEPLEAHLARTLDPAGFMDPAGFLQRKFGGGECLVLLDALDEVMDEAAYRWMAGEIAEFASRWPGVPVVVTCRTAGFRDELALLPGFRRVEVQEFTDREVERFVRSWFEGAGGEARAEGLRQALARNPRMRQLAPNPLLLSLMCFNYDLDLRLPDRRVELYERCAGELLRKLAAEGRFRTEDKREALRAIARRFHGAGARVFGEGPLLETIAAALQDLGLAARPDEFLRELMARTGLIRQQSRTSYGFAHLTWQEFFAAEDVQRRGAVDSLLARAGDPWWREVILLCAGLQPDATESVRRLMERDLLLGAAALADATDPRTEAFDAVKRKTLDRLKDVAATDKRRRQDAADAAAALGRFGGSGWLADRVRDRERPEVALAALLALDHAGDREVLAALCEPLGPVLQLLCGQLAKCGTLEPRVLALLDRLGLPLVPVPAGEFKMGDPAHPVRLERYWIGKYPVTDALYRRFCAETGTAPPREASAADRAEHPVVNVSWHEAVAFCRWCGTQLPSEAEWEKAARGTDGRQYPWGDRWETGRCNVGTSGTSLVGAYPGDVSPYGCFDMAGNVREWTRSLYRPYPYEPGDGRESLEGSERRVLRGGSFVDDRRNARCAYRDWDVPVNWDRYFGFRVVASPFASGL